MSLDWQKTTITPCFKELRREGIRATVKNLACCTNCGHSDHEGSEAYVGFTLQDRDYAREHNEDWMYLFHHLPKERHRQKAVEVLRKYFCVAWDETDEHKILVSRKRNHWKLLRDMYHMRRVALYWLSLTVHLYQPPHGRGFKRDLASFIEDELL